jgi:ribonuclease HII
MRGEIFYSGFAKIKLFMNTRYERKLIRSGYATVCGVDEVGRGAYAGPIVAGAVILDFNQKGLFKKINDSKLLAPGKREQIAALIIKSCLAWSISSITNCEIDRFGLSAANKKVLIRACQNLLKEPEYILSDYMAGTKYHRPFELIKSGDKKLVSIAAASIVAKVFRDRMMRAFALQYPQYGFEKHKGYGTKLHQARLKEFGPSLIHRLSYSIY